MSDAPTLPGAMSNDGREIWEWAGKMSEHTQKLHKIRELRVRIRKIQSECGSCDMWMTRTCPREVHSNTTGRNTGPSCASPKCERFSESRHSKSLREQWQSELEILSPTTTGD